MSESLVAQMLQAVTRLLLDAVAPLRCAVCDQVGAREICNACVVLLIGQPRPAVRQLACGTAYAAWEFRDPVRNAIHRGKYGADRDALRRLAAIAAERLQPALPAAPDAIVPVPLGARRQRQRGYNQAQVIAEVLAGAAASPMVPMLIRNRDTSPQSSRDEEARRSNVAGAFAWRGANLDRASIWLVDDVLTTGATVAAAAEALRRGGARRVDAVVLATVL